MVALLLAHCTSESTDAPGARLAIDVAPLNLVGVGDVVWDLEVVNGASTPETVWQRRVSSSRYGDGAGSASYVGTCDAASNPNTVRVWVVGVYGAAVTDPGSFNRGATDGVGAVTFTGAPLAFQNPTASAALTREVDCLANSDVAVAFDVALMRPARQGFFDIAVNFSDIFCSAKFDCCDDANANDACDDGEDIDLLFTAGDGRGRTMVLGFACTAGTDATDATTLYMNDLAFDCTSPTSGFVADFSVNPAGATPGNQCDAGDMASCDAVIDPAPAQADTYLFQIAVYRGDELLQSEGGAAHKVYWNVALGVKAGIGDCVLRTGATADNPNDARDGLVGGVVSRGAVYPYVAWDVPLGTCASEPLSFDGTTSVQTDYTETTATGATSFGYAFAPGAPPAPVCAAPCLNGGACTGPNTCTCTGSWTGATCDTAACGAGQSDCPMKSCKAVLAAGGSTGDGAYAIDPDGPGVGAPAFDVWCDMTTDDGGWTLVGYNQGVDRTFLTGTWHAVAGALVPQPSSQAAMSPAVAALLDYSELGFYLDDPQWDDAARSYTGFWIGDDPLSTYNLASNACQLLRPTDAGQWQGKLVYFAGDGANDNGCAGGGSYFASGHTCDDGGGGVTTNNSWPTNGGDTMWGYNCISSYSPTGAYKNSAIHNQGLHAYYVR
ncbi:MAG: hypothetical protein CVU56_25400 [Deltaproteobacteria bacterium HGW-Deltaproteobacteria-14]|nr:MAG: hypothetical protein CVU56_25400 [Deltaproteobacteria bacterium HGW-Deltaproteobacteria-14]